MTVTVNDVRRYLADISSDLLSDETIQTQLELAETYIASVKDSDASSELVDKAVLTRAGHLSFLAYMKELERARGGEAPSTVYVHSQELKDIALRFEALVSGGGVPFAVGTSTSSRYEDLKSDGLSW